ncbi:MAG: cardiolipin synthase [Blastomonas sp.]
MEILSALVDHWAFTALSWIIRIGALIVVPFRRPAAEARSWLLLFFIVPVPTLIVYNLIGRPEHSKARRERARQCPDVLRRVLGWEDSTRFSDDHLVPEQHQALADLGHAISHMPVMPGNALELLGDYDAAIDRLVADIDSARHHVHLEFYIFAADRTGDKVMSALERAEARGVTCRVLIDAMGSIGSSNKVKRRLVRSGVEVHRLLPFLHRLRSSRVDLRNHRKIAVIDGLVGYTGSQNIIDRQARPGGPANTELLVRVTGPAVRALQAVFVGDWYLEKAIELPSQGLVADNDSPGRVSAQLLPSGPDFERGSIDLFFIDAIHNANAEITITTPYFIPNGALIAAICSARLRGVNVELILPRRTDNWLVTMAERSYFEHLLAAGVTIIRYDTGFLHAKHMRIDNDLAIIGSSNMDLRSFELNAEVSLVCYCPQIVRELREIERGYCRDATVIDSEHWARRPIYKKVIENCARMASDLM